MTRIIRELHTRGSGSGADRQSLRFTGLLLFVLSAEFLTVLMLAAAMRPGYTFHTAAISDLGVYPETALLFNGSLVLVGALNLLAGYYFFAVHDRRWLLSLYFLASVGAVGTALFPLGSGPLHELFAFVSFLFFNLEAIGSGLHVGGILRPLSILAGVIGLAFLAAFVIGSSGATALFGPFGYGGTERMIAYPVLLWALVFGGYLLGATAWAEAP